MTAFQKVPLPHALTHSETGKAATGPHDGGGVVPSTPHSNTSLVNSQFSTWGHEQGQVAQETCHKVSTPPARRPGPSFEVGDSHWQMAAC